MTSRAWALVPGLSLALALAGASCTTRTSYVDCDEVVRRCRTVCDYWCDRWGCYPVCYDRCWDDCYVYPSPPATSVPPRASDAGAPGSPGAPLPNDAGASPGEGILCSPCGSNDDCREGALCIQRGGVDAGGAFCSHACAASTDCPEGFSCAPVGSVTQCLPNEGSCE